MRSVKKVFVALMVLALIRACVTFVRKDRTNPVVVPKNAPAIATPVSKNSPTNAAIAPSHPLPVAPSPSASILTPLEEALHSGDKEHVRTAAAELRKRARTDPAALAELGRALLDPAVDPQVRISLAAILGTLPDPAAREWLCRAIRAPGIPEEVLAWAITALAAVKKWEVDDVFHGMDSPDVAETPGGLQLTASEPVADRGARELLRGMLTGSPPSAIEEALVRTLVHSLEYEEVRATFAARIGSVADRSVQADMAAGLAAWTVQAPAGQEDERRRMGQVLFGLAELPDNAALRLVLQPFSAQLPWPAGEGERLVAMAGSGTDFDQRYWAIELLGSQAGRLAADKRAEAGGLLLSILRADGEAKLREKAAAALVGYEQDPGAGAALLAAVRSDSAWNVRLVAVQALGRLVAPPPAAAAVLEEAARNDPDENVRAAAVASLARIAGRK